MTNRKQQSTIDAELSRLADEIWQLRKGTDSPYLKYELARAAEKLIALMSQS